MSPSSRSLRIAALALSLTACGGGGGGGSSSSAPSATGSAAPSPTSSPSPAPGPTSAPSPSPAPGPSPSPAPGPSPSPAPAPTINSEIGKPNRMLVGLGSGNDISVMQAQGISPDIIDTYLVGVGANQWPYYNTPTGSYVVNVINADEAVGAVPHLTLYQMATNGDGNIADINDPAFMTAYWSQVKLMYTEIASTGDPVLVNLEPDFWGYVQLQAPSGDPTKLAAQVTIQPECANLPNTAVGIAQCLLTLGHTYAPKAKIGIPPSFFGENGTSVGNFMKALGAQNADFIVGQTSDRDAGCFEAALPGGNPPECTGRGNGPFYWDESNQTLPNFADNLADYVAVRNILGNNLPILYWQTPLGVPSSTPGGTTNHYRANQVHYMLTHASDYVNAGVFGIVFSGGATSQTNISTDGGQFKTLSSAYLANPVAYP